MQPESPSDRPPTTGVPGTGTATTLLDGETFELLGRHINEVLLLYRGDSMVWVSPSAKDHFGWDPAELAGRHWSSILDPDEVATVRPFWEAAKSENRTRYRVRVRSVNGDRHWLSVVSTAVRDDSAERIGTLLSARVIDEDVAAEEQLRALAEQKSRLIERLPIGVFHVRSDSAGDLVPEFLSARALEILGLDPQRSVTIAELQDIVQHDDWQDLLAAGQAAVAGSQSLLWEGRLARKETWLRLEAELDLLDDGDLVIEGVLRDITSYKNAEIRLLSDTAEARQQAAHFAGSDRMKSVLLASLAHDLRTPLTVITSSAASLKDCAGESEREELRANIEVSARTLTRLITDLLDVHRIGAGAKAILMEPVDLIDGLREPLRNAASAVDLGIPEDLPPMAADPVLLERILDNLLRNAAAHQPAGIPVLIAARQDDDRVRIDVIDRGRGVDPGEYRHMFEPYRRLDARGAGVGIGLAIAREFAEAMGGRIIPSATPDGGLTMTVEMGVADGTTAAR